MMSRLSISIKKNIPLLIVAIITVVLFIYPYLKISNTPKAAEEKKSAIPVTVSPIIKGKIQQQYQSIGTVHGQYEIPVLSQVDGVLQQVGVKIGDAVAKGQSLAKLDTRLLLADLQTAKAQHVKSTDELKRAQTLVDRRLANQTRLQTAIAQKTADEENVRRLSAILSFANFPSPVKGIVTEQNVSLGNTVQAGNPLFTVSDVSKLIIYTKIPENLAAHLHVGDTALLKSESIFTGSLSANIISVYPASDPISHQVGIELDAGAVYPKLKPGYQVTVLLSTSIRENVLTVDRNALNEDIEDGEAIVFVVIDRKKVEERNIQLGVVSEDKVEVINGLSEGDVVVTKGMDRLQNGSLIKIVSNQETIKD